MKKIMFACTLILSGILGFTGVMIDAVSKSGGYTEILSCFHGSDFFIAGAMLIIAAAGVIIALREISEK